MSDDVARVTLLDFDERKSISAVLSNAACASITREMR